ncbi:Mitochondrial GTPase 1 [Massospora cicadina]|nr:Mitochondrial GTPase 1 [Massospora cicadina]
MVMVTPRCLSAEQLVKKGFEGFRKTYTVPERAINWFPGHMAKGLRLMQEKLSSIDLLVETRDARIPLSSINPKFEELLATIPRNGAGRALASRLTRIVVYNKCDLIPLESQSTIRNRMLSYTKDQLLFTSADLNINTKKILEIARRKAKENPLKFPFINIMVVGMPNVGKSSLINALRRIGANKGKAVKTGAQPGVTRSIGSQVKVSEDPLVYLVDTPGVMIPHIPDPQISLKVALTGGIHDHLADPELLVDYLLFRLNDLGAAKFYTDRFGGEPTDSVHELLNRVASHAGLLSKGGVPDTYAAAQNVLRTFRQGKLGRFVFDDISSEGFEDYFQYLKLCNNLTPSKNFSDRVAAVSKAGNLQIIPSKHMSVRAKRQARLEKIRLKRISMPPPSFDSLAFGSLYLWIKTFFKVIPG